MNTDASDRELLLTCDGKGKEAKAEALERIIQRALGEDAVPVLDWLHESNDLRPPGWCAAQHPSISQVGTHEMVPAYLVRRKTDSHSKQ